MSYATYIIKAPSPNGSVPPPIPPLERTRKSHIVLYNNRHSLDPLSADTCNGVIKSPNVSTPDTYRSRVCPCYRSRRDFLSLCVSSLKLSLARTWSLGVTNLTSPRYLERLIPPLAHFLPRSPFCESYMLRTGLTSKDMDLSRTPNSRAPLATLFSVAECQRQLCMSVELFHLTIS